MIHIDEILCNVDFTTNQNQVTTTQNSSSYFGPDGCNLSAGGIIHGKKNSAHPSALGSHMRACPYVFFLVVLWSYVYRRDNCGFMIFCARNGPSFPSHIQLCGHDSVYSGHKPTPGSQYGAKVYESTRRFRTCGLAIQKKFTLHCCVRIPWDW